jgi:iron complex transport system ATP-binding protein
MGRYPHRSRFSAPTSADQQAVERALDRTRTAAFADRPIDELSGGQRQRVVLARAVAQATPTLLLDEPTASLDVNHQVEMLSLVRSLVADGRAVVAAIHDLDLAARYCDRIALLADGTVRTIGPPADVLSADTLSTVFETRAAVTHDPTTGTPTVTTFPGAREGDRGDHSDTNPLRVHVLGSGPTAGSVVARLAAADVDVSVGPVTDRTVAAWTAEQHDLDVIETSPFTPLSETVRGELATALGRADVVVHASPAPELDAQVDLRPRCGSTPIVAVGSPPEAAEQHRAADEIVAEPAPTAPVTQSKRQPITATPETVLDAVHSATDSTPTTRR